MEREDFIKEILVTVGDKILEKNNTLSEYSEEKGYLAESDMVAHQLFKENILLKFPADQIISEEDNLDLNKLKFKSEFCWLIDPICGTANFLYGFPFYSHSATIFKDGIPYAAGVYDPLRKEMFYSFNKKFYLNDKLYKIIKNNRLKDAHVSINANQASFKKENMLVDILKQISPPICRRNKILESANLELAYVACGRLDAYFNPTDKPWDIAASLLMVPASGGFIKIFDEADNFFEQKGIIAASSEALLNEIVQRLN
jgi:myo-inositol-1(or 4)-monophosphatase